MAKRYGFDDVHSQIAIARRMLARNGLDGGVGGHVCVRVPDEDAFWMTPYQYFEETVPDDIGKISFGGEQLEGSRELPLNPSAFHAAILERRPDVNSTIHLHSHYVCVWSTTGRPVETWHHESVFFHDKQAIYVEDGIKPTISPGEIAELMSPDRRVVFFKNHGAVLAAESLAHCTIDAICLEKTCSYAVHAEVIGGTPMGKQEVDALEVPLRGTFHPNMWLANVRRLRVTDPDLFALIDDEQAPGAAVAVLEAVEV